MRTSDHFVDTASTPAPPLSARREGDTIHLAGDLDLWTGDALSKLLDESAEADVVVDLSEVLFLDSIGVRGLISARSAGRVVGYVNPTPNVRRVLEVMGLADELLVQGAEPRR